MLKIVSPVWNEYELIDSGGFEKLERFGKYVISRPEPQAIWDKTMDRKSWDNLATAKFSRSEGSSEKGSWALKKGMPEQWWMEYNLGATTLKMRLGLTSFKHVGVFPEQADNWKFLYESMRSFTGTKNVLNLFAYTGVASLAARAGGADVVHLDSVKPVVTWARENMEQSNLDGIRWVVEDALKFVKREVSRGKKYQGLILDPPAYGRGPKGEKWVLEDFLPELLNHCEKLMDRKNRMVVLNLYSMGLSSLVAESLLKTFFQQESEFGELYFEDRAKRKLPLGIYARFSTLGGLSQNPV